MLSEQRQYEITEFICREGKASIAELAERFGVSGETIRRDLNAIAKENKVRKVHGGAVAVHHPIRDESYAVRQQQKTYNKQKIGEYAASLLSDNDMVGIDAGTCTEAFARAIYGVNNLKLVTHSIPIAAILAQKIAAGDFTGSILLLGGSVNPESCTASGLTTLTQLNNYRFDKAIVSATALSFDGVMAGSENDGIISSAFLKAAESAYVLAESEKLDKQSFYRVATYDEVTAIITDNESLISAELKKNIKDSGAELITVSLDGEGVNNQ